MGIPIARYTTFSEIEGKISPADIRHLVSCALTTTGGDDHHLLPLTEQDALALEQELLNPPPTYQFQQ